LLCRTPALAGGAREKRGSARTQSEWFHRFFAVFFLIYLLTFVGINLRLLT